ncbi:MAG: peptide chain release factor N(5)-glutamine methyltransferase [Gaiellales bacterium]|jgi:release factor glutamine methyltransferase|nr:peptide chain release factor N(5)-glutamine methyltransferase [Gaiellales bacterium]
MAEAMPGGMKNVKDVVALSSAYLAAKGIDTARLDAEKLIGSVLGLDRLALYLHHDRPVTPAELDAIRPLLRRRADLEPVAYILGEVGFHRLVLKTDARALMPRSETETLVEVVLANLPKGGTLLDVGTGSGAIAIAVSHERPDVTVTAVDCSTAALSLARENADRIGVAVEFLESDLAAAVVGRTFDVVAANLPYIPEGDPRTEAGVVRHEPHLALYAGPDGLELIRRLVADAPALLNPGGMIVLENSDEQAAAVRELLAAAGFGEVAFHRDLAGVDRVVAGRLG